MNLYLEEGHRLLATRYKADKVFCYDFRVSVFLHCLTSNNQRYITGAKEYGDTYEWPSGFE